MSKKLKEVICIKPTFTEQRGLYVSNYNQFVVDLSPPDDAMQFTSKQKALDYLEGFPYLKVESDINVNSFTLEIIYFIIKD